MVGVAVVVVVAVVVAVAVGVAVVVAVVVGVVVVGVVGVGVAVVVGVVVGVEIKHALCAKENYMTEKHYNRTALLLALAGVAFAFLTLGLAADAATITVSPGGSIQSAINSAVAGDTVLVRAGTYTGNGLVVDRAITLQGEPGAILQASTPGGGIASGNGILIAAHGVTVAGLDVRDFGIGIGVDGIRNPTSAKYNDVTIRNCRIYRAQNGTWINGDRWLVEGVDYDKNYLWSGGDSNYNTVFGNNHVIRGCYAHNTIIGNGTWSDIMPNHVGTYDTGPGSHLDFVQSWNQSGQVLTNLLVEGNIVTDFIDGIFIADEAGTGTIRGVTVRNNVFIGTNFTAVSGQLGTPSHVIAGGKGVGIGDLLVEYNTIHNAALGVTATGGTRPTVRNNIFSGVGTVFDFRDGTTQAMCVASGNLLHNGGWPGQYGDFGSAKGDPQFINITDILGADKLLRTADDGYVARALIAAGKGAVFAAAPAPTPEPEPTPEPTPTPTPTYATQADLDALALRVRALEDAKAGLRLDAVEAWRKLFPQSTRQFRDRSGIWRNAPSN